MRFTVLLFVTILAVPRVEGGQNSDFDNEMARSAETRFGATFRGTPTSSRYGLDWTKAELKESREYSKISASLDRNFVGNAQQTAAYVEKLRKEAILKPNDPAAQYAWGYTAIKQSAKEAREGKDYWSGYLRLTESAVLRWQLAAVTDPGSKEFTRLRFLVETGPNYFPEVVALGRRLLLDKPKDLPVKRALAIELGASKDKEELSEALRLSDELLAADPNGLSYIRLKAYLYGQRWLHLGAQKEDGLRLIKWDEKYVDVAPQGSEVSQAISRFVQNFKRTSFKQRYP